MNNNKKTSLSNVVIYSGIYNDLAEILGKEEVELIYKSFKGQQITFPKRLYSKEYVIQEVSNLYNGSNLKQLAIKFDYTERHLKKILDQSKISND